MFKHWKISLTIGLILTAAMTAYVSVTPVKTMNTMEVLTLVLVIFAALSCIDDYRKK